MNCIICRMRRQNSASAHLFQNCIKTHGTEYVANRHSPALPKSSVLFCFWNRKDGQDFPTDFWHLWQVYFPSGYIMLFVCAGLWVTLPFHISNSQNPKDISQTHRNFYEKCVKTISNYSQIILKPSWHLTFQVLDLFNIWKRRTLDRRYDLWWTTSRAVCFTTLIPNVTWCDFRGERQIAVA